MEEEDLVLAEFKSLDRTFGPVDIYQTKLSLRNLPC